MNQRSLVSEGLVALSMIAALAAGVLVHVEAGPSRSRAPARSHMPAAQLAPTLGGGGGLIIRNAGGNDSPPPPAALPASQVALARIAAAQRHSPTATPVVSTGRAWITLGAYSTGPNAWMVPVHGGGFGRAERVAFSVVEAAGVSDGSLTADSTGQIDGTVAVRFAASASGTLHLVATGVSSHVRAMASFAVIPYVATIWLTPYAALPGQTVLVDGQGYLPNEALALDAGGRAVQTLRADSGGAIHATFAVSYTAPASHLVISITGAMSHASASQTLSVLALQPWATASNYALRAGDHVQFDAHGFASRERITVYDGDTVVGHGGPTDDQGSAGGVGPFTVQGGDPQPVFELVGDRSGARVGVTLTVLAQ